MQELAARDARKEAETEQRKMLSKEVRKDKTNPRRPSEKEASLEEQVKEAAKAALSAVRAFVRSLKEHVLGTGVPDRQVPRTYALSGSLRFRVASSAEEAIQQKARSARGESAWHGMQAMKDAD
jgi:hypothetical protein